MFCNVLEEQSNLPICFWQAQLVSHAQQMGMDDSGTKNDLVERLLNRLSTGAVAEPFVQANDRQVAPLACNMYKVLIYRAYLFGQFCNTLQRMVCCHSEYAITGGGSQAAG